MRRTAFILAVIYVAFVVLFVAVLPRYALAVKEGTPRNWTIILLMGCGIAVLLTLAQLALLWRRPLDGDAARAERSPILIPALGMAVATGFLFSGYAYALFEFLHTSQIVPDSDLLNMAVLLLPLYVWGFWFLWFRNALRRAQDDRKPITWLKGLLVGSVLELLVAVPVHVWARRKDECCGGIFTLGSLVFGTALLAFVFGPAALLLYHDRLKKKKPSAS